MNNLMISCVPRLVEDSAASITTGAGGGSVILAAAVEVKAYFFLANQISHRDLRAQRNAEVYNLITDYRLFGTFGTTCYIFSLFLLSCVCELTKDFYPFASCSIVSVVSRSNFD